MTASIQPVLSCDESTASDLTVFLTHGGTTYEVYLGVALLERVGAGAESVAQKMLVGRLFNAGVRIGKLAEGFGHCSRTIKKWAAALLSGDIDEIARAFAGREGKRKTSPELIRYAQQLYRDRHVLGRNYRQVIIDKVAQVFGVSLSTATMSGIFGSMDASDPVDVEGSDVTSTLQSASEPPPGEDGSVKQSPVPLPAQLMEPRAGREWIHHAGQVLFTEGMQGISDPLQRQFIGQVLQGAVNVEQSKTLCSHSLTNFTGPVVNGLREQRQGLDQQATAEEISRIYKRNAALLGDGPGSGDLFYFDPHTKEYTGQLRTLKGWCGRRHGIVRTINLDSFHTRSGRPCFIRHYSPYYDMRERFFMSLAEFNLLFAPERRRSRRFVIDRGIYSLPVLQSFAPDYVITWEKNYSGDGWDENRPVIAFSRSTPKNSRTDLHTTRFECQEMPWHRDPSFRRIIVRAAKENGDTVEASVITSHPGMDVQDVVWAIFRRWLQENDFKYLDVHFGINQLSSRDSSSFRDRADDFEDRPVDSPEYRQLKKTLNALETRLGRQLIQLRKAKKQDRELKSQEDRLTARRAHLAKRMETVAERLRNGLPPLRGSRNIGQEADDLTRSLKATARKRQRNAGTCSRLNDRINEIEGEIKPLETQLCNAVRTSSRLQMLIDGDCRLLDTRKKALMDALRVTASNIFRNVQEQFRAICDNFRDDHVLVRALSRCSGTLEKAADKTTFQLWMPGTFQPHRLRAIEQLLAQLEAQANEQIETARPLRIELLTGPISL